MCSYDEVKLIILFIELNNFCNDDDDDVDRDDYVYEYEDNSSISRYRLRIRRVLTLRRNGPHIALK